jgi:hypothetical protein
MNGRLQGFLNFLDLLAEGQRRQAEVVTGRRFEAPAGLVPVQAENVVKFLPLHGYQTTEEIEMNAYSTIRNTGYAAVLVAALAGIVSNALTADQKIIYERDLAKAAAEAILPEVVVSATRLEW